MCYCVTALPIWRIVQRWGATRAPYRVCGRQCTVYCLFHMVPENTLLPLGNQSVKPRGLGQSPSVTVFSDHIPEADRLLFADIGNTPIMVVYAIDGKIQWVSRSEDFPFWRFAQNSQSIYCNIHNYALGGTIFSMQILFPRPENFLSYSVITFPSA